MYFDPCIRIMNAILRDHDKIFESERANFGGINSHQAAAVENGELFRRQEFSGSKVVLETRLTLLPAVGLPGLSLTLFFFDHKGGERIERGSVAVVGHASVVENRARIDWEIVAKRSSPHKLPRGAERLTGRLRAYLRSQEPRTYDDRYRQLVSTIYCYALQGECSLD
ncbi:hypothetical protein IT087_00925 [Candidatus Uhrbacteria bacterium]|nr:hypothetical protein [Candidatus Uhrbacteria bacterium]